MTDTQKQQTLLLRREGRSYADIATAVGASPGTVKTYCHRHRTDLDLPAAPGASTGYCLNCGQRIEQAPKRKPRKFCCDRCRELWWNQNRRASERGTLRVNCAYCGKTFETRRCNGQRFCSHEHYILSRFGEVSQP